MTIGEHYENVTNFYNDCILPYMDVPVQSGFNNILVTGQHIKWISFRDHIKRSYSFINDFIVQNSNRNPAAKKLLERILEKYLKICHFINLHVSHEKRETRDNPMYCYSRDITAEEVKEAVQSGMEKIMDLYPEIDKKLHYLCMQNLSPTAHPADDMMHSRFSCTEFVSVMNELEKLGMVDAEDGKYIWKSTKALYGYFVAVSSVFIGLRKSDERIPWSLYRRLIKNHDDMERGARSSANEWNNEGLSKPCGYDIIDKLLFT